MTELVKPNKKLALMLARREVVVYVYDAVQLEGINFTLPEIQTLMDGVTVGGHKLSDQQIAVNQADAWRKLFADLDAEAFELSASYAKSLHAIAGKEEALEWGCFRSGGVTIAGTQYLPPNAQDLPCLFDQMVREATNFECVLDRSIFVFLTMARTQFFYDVNKRMGRFMMNGLLLDSGYPAINVPAKRKLEFNSLMLEFYETNNMEPMNQFMRSCIDPRVVKILSEA